MFFVFITYFMCQCKYYLFFHIMCGSYIYRVIQEESAILWEMIVCVILSKKVHINMCPIFYGYEVTGIFLFPVHALV
jgi:hypothetical protein